MGLHKFRIMVMNRSGDCYSKDYYHHNNNSLEVKQVQEALNLRVIHIQHKERVV